jgi:hypothetical protein
MAAEVRPTREPLVPETGESQDQHPGEQAHDQADEKGQCHQVDREVVQAGPHAADPEG